MNNSSLSRNSFNCNGFSQKTVTGAECKPITVTVTDTATPSESVTVTDSKDVSVTVTVTATGIGNGYSAPSYPLSIELLPQQLQWWDEPRYWLIHEVTGLRMSGSWSISESLEIQEFSRYWDWTVDPKSRIPNCQHEILNLCVQVCDRKTTQVNQKRSPNQQESAVFCNLTEVN